MSYLVKTDLWWFAVPAHDTPEIVGYKLYLTTYNVPVERDLSGNVPGAQVFDLGKPDPDAEGKCHIDLATLPNMTTNDGRYNLGIASVDKAGNESSFALVLDEPLDFIAPDAPSAAGILRS